MTLERFRPAIANEHRQLFLATATYIIFCALSLLSQWIDPLFGLVVLMGLAVPLVWAGVTGRWYEIGFRRDHLSRALFWGIAAGLLAGLIGAAVVPQRALPDRLGVQLALGLPIWFLIASPFQEFFFRGWLQTRYERALGRGWGLLLSTFLFTLWHYFAPFVGQTVVPLNSIIGATSTFAAGLVYGYAFQRTGNIITPWLAHSLTGLTFIFIGAMDFTVPLM